MFEIELFICMKMDLGLNYIQRLTCHKTQTNKTTHLGQGGLGSDGNKGVFRIPQCPNISEASPPDCLVSYLGHSLRESYPFAEMPNQNYEKIFHRVKLIRMITYPNE